MTSRSSALYAGAKDDRTLTNDRARHAQRILVIHPELKASGGGGCALAAFALEVLSQHFETDVLTCEPVDIGALDRMFGTHLADCRIQNLTFGKPSRLLWSMSPGLWRVRRALTARECHRHATRRRHSLLVSTNEEVDFGSRGPGVQYVNWPLTNRPTHAADRPWFLPLPLIALYRGLTARIAPWDPQRVARNATMANSEFSAAAVRRVYGIEPVIVYPPVPGAFPDVPWYQRQPRFVCVGRLSIGEKDLLKVVDIVAGVRARGHDVGLDLAGTFVTRADLERLRAEQRRHGDWLSIHVNLERPALVELISTRRYGLHGNVGEHFGIAVAEYLRAGIIPFVPAHGGCAEIVGQDPRFLYGSAEEAVERIAHMLESTDAETRMRAFVAGRKDLFSVGRFQTELMTVVDKALEQG